MIKCNELPPTHYWTEDFAKEQIEAAVLAEREACAKVCEEYHSPGAVAYVTDVAAAIRERNGNAS